MDDLELLAHSHAQYWAELVFSKFVTDNAELPAEWPGSIDQARLLVAFASREHLDAGNAEQLADALLDRARFLWREFRSFRAA